MKKIILISSLLFSFYTYGDMKEVYLRKISQSLAYLVADKIYVHRSNLCEKRYNMKIVLTKTREQKERTHKEWEKCMTKAYKEYVKNQKDWR